MENITLGYDDSATARSALDWVVDRCRRREAQVTIVDVSTLWSGERAGRDDSLEEAARVLQESAPATGVITVRLHGPVAKELADISEGADLLVLGVHRDARLRALVSGMLPLRVTARAHLPVVVVPQGWQPAEGAVVVGIDDDDSSEPALEFAVREAAADHRPLHLVHGWLVGGTNLPEPVEDASSSRIAEAHHRILAAATQRARNREPALVVRESLVRDNPTSALAHAAGDAATIVIGTHGRGPTAGVFLGSVAWDLVGELDTVLCVVPRQP